METLRLAKLPAVAGSNWVRLGLLAALGVAIGLLLSLTTSLPVS